MSGQKLDTEENKGNRFRKDRCNRLKSLKIKQIKITDYTGRGL